MGPLLSSTQLVHHSRMKRTDPQFKLRLPDELKRELEELAGMSGRSLTAEIVWRLEQSLISPAGREGGAMQRFVDSLIEAIARHVPSAATRQEILLQAVSGANDQAAAVGKKRTRKKRSEELD